MTDIPKVTFSATHASLPGVNKDTIRQWELFAENAPIVPASSVLPDWYKKLNTDFEPNVPPHMIEDPFNRYKDHQNQPTVKKCPGIFDFLHAGYIVPAWSDFVFRWSEKSEYIFEFKGSIPVERLRRDGMTPVVLGHDHPQAEGAPFWDNSCKDIMKIVSPWTVDTSEGISVMLLQPYYHNSTEYTVMPGLLDSDMNHIANKQIQIFIKINVQGKNIFIEKGTPLLQVIPFKRTDYMFECISRPTEEMHKDFEVLASEPFLRMQDIPKEEGKRIANESKCPFGYSASDPNRRQKTMIYNRKQDGKNYNKREV